MFNRTASPKIFVPSRQARKELDESLPNNLTADFRRLSQVRIRTLHCRDAEYAEEIPFAQSGDDDWAKTFSSDLSNVFVCRRLLTNKNLILCALCPSTSSGSRAQSRDASAVIFIKGFLSLSICVNLRLVAFDALRFALSALLPAGFASCFASSRSPCGVLALVETSQLGRAVTPQGESSFPRFRKPKFNRKFQIFLMGLLSS